VGGRAADDCQTTVGLNAPARRVLIAALAIEAGLIALHIPARIADGAKIFRLDEEANLPTWFSSSQFLIAGLVCAALAFGEKRRRTGWAVLAVLMVMFSLDEVAEIHERVEDKAGFDLALLVLEPLVGVAVLVVVWRAMRTLSGAPATFLVLALAAAFLAQLMSIVTGHFEPSSQAVEYVVQALEEVFEMLTGTFVLVAALSAGAAAWTAVVVRLTTGRR